jgi:hypothetical protein
MSRPPGIPETGSGVHVVGSNPSYPAVFLSDSTVTLTLCKVQSEAGPAPFDRKRNVGLQHAALTLAHDVSTPGNLR